MPSHTVVSLTDTAAVLEWRVECTVYETYGYEPRG
jgi:hypothetical protein